MSRPGRNIETFSALVESVYDAAFHPRSWETFLRGLAAALNAKSGLFRVIDERGPSLRTGIYYNLDPDLQADYRRYYVRQDPIVEALAQLPDVYIAPGEAFLDPQRYRNTEFFTDYAAPQDNVHICGGLAMRSETCTIKFGVQRDRRTGAFQWADARFIQRLVPHIQRAARLAQLLETVEAESQAAGAALDSLGVALWLLDRRQRIVHRNAGAERLLRGSAPLAECAGRLVAAAGQPGGRLGDILDAALTQANGGAPATPQGMLVAGTADEPARLLVACPVTDRLTHFKGPWPEPALAVFLCTPEEAGIAGGEILRKLYGLTAREGDLAVALSRGKDLAALQREWQLSRETLRTHLKRVLAKTGHRRQVDLVRTLASCPWNLMT